LSPGRAVIYVSAAPMPADERIEALRSRQRREFPTGANGEMTQGRLLGC
jgi:hypothetical protein